MRWMRWAGPSMWIPMSNGSGRRFVVHDGWVLTIPDLTHPHTGALYIVDVSSLVGEPRKPVTFPPLRIGYDERTVRVDHYPRPE